MVPFCFLSKAYKLKIRILILCSSQSKPIIHMGTYKYDKLKSQNKLPCILTIAFYNHIFLKGVCVWSCAHSQIKLQ